jgi:DNA-binding transcriptional LysR family regulator
MPTLPFTLRQLEIFSSLSATRSFRQTAERLGISQASVSSQLKSLERQLGVELLDRSPGRRPIILPEGAAFLEDLHEFEQVAAHLAAHRRVEQGQLHSVRRYKVLVGQGMFDTYIRRKLDQFYATHANVELDFEAQLPFGQLMRAVESGQFDFALINQRSDRALHSDFRQVAMVRGGIYGHIRFAEGRKLPLTVPEINQLPFIIPTSSPNLEREVMKNYADSGIIPRHIAGYTQYYDVIAAMLERGLGIASFSEALLSPAVREQVVLLHPMQDWRLMWYQRHEPRHVHDEDVAKFLLESVVEDPDYPALGR